MKWITRVLILTCFTILISQLLITNYKSYRISQVGVGEDIFNYTTCGKSAFKRGFGQKVISFSFYENGLSDRRLDSSFEIPDYFNGIKENIILQPYFYPDWTIRLYHDLQHDDPLLNTLQNYTIQYDYFDLCHAHHLPNQLLKDANDIFPMIWRFFPTLDPQVNLFMSRDLDSKFTERESAAVSEWVESGAPIHAMRDNIHHNVPLLGAGWGASLLKNGTRELWRLTWGDILDDSTTYSHRWMKGPDQDILTEHVWPWGQDMALQHDSYTCEMRQGTIGFPTERKNEDQNFIAAIGAMRLWEECPEKCRRKKEWIHC